MPKRDYQSVPKRDGLWIATDGAQIKKVSPRGMVLYAVTRPGERTVWVDSLAEARAL